MIFNEENMENLIFRDALLTDLDIMVEIYNSIIPSRIATAETEYVKVEDKIKWFNEHNPSKRPLWIIENYLKQTIGWVSFQSFYGRIAYDATVEISIYLKAEQRGKGIGKKILKYCIDNGPKFGFKTLLGFIFSHNEPSLKLFKSLGFDEWGTLPNIAIMDGKEYGLKILGKRIS